LGSGGIATRVLDLGNRWRWVVSSTPRPLYPQGKSPWYSLDRRLGGHPEIRRASSQQNKAEHGRHYMLHVRNAVFWPYVRDNSVWLRAGRPGFNYWQGCRFTPRHLVKTCYVAHAVSLTVMRPEREANHSPPSSDQVENGWCYTFTLRMFLSQLWRLTCARYFRLHKT